LSPDEGHPVGGRARLSRCTKVPASLLGRLDSRSLHPPSLPL